MSRADYPPDMPSVTEILGRTGWTGDFGGMPRDRLAQLAEVGTYVHACTEAMDTEQLDLGATINQAQSALERNPYFAHVANYLKGYALFRAEIEVQILGSEQAIRNDLLGYCGTLDRRVMIAGEEAVVDIKTAQSVSASWALQLAAYAMAVEVVTPMKRFALRLMRDGTYRLDQFDGPDDRELFAIAARSVNAQIAAKVWRVQRRDP